MTDRQRTLALAALEYLALDLDIGGGDAAAYLNGRLGPDEDLGAPLLRELNDLIDAVRRMPGEGEGR